jgi:hypothetical protein
MWRLALVLRWPPARHVVFGIVLIFKWAVWFPVMVIRHGFSGALDAADVYRGRIGSGDKGEGASDALFHRQPRWAGETFQKTPPDPPSCSMPSLPPSAAPNPAKARSKGLFGSSAGASSRDRAS